MPHSTLNNKPLSSAARKYKQLNQLYRIRNGVHYFAHDDALPREEAIKLAAKFRAEGRKAFTESNRFSVGYSYIFVANEQRNSVNRSAKA
jgi:hypothetical protein